LIRDGKTRMVDGDLTLREVRREDAQLLLDLRNDERTRWYFGEGREVDGEDHRQFVERYFSPANDDRWFIVELESRPIGTISLYGVSLPEGKATWGRFVIAPETRGQGWGRRALALLIRHAEEIGVVDLDCEVIASNDHAIRLYRSCGFSATGTMTRNGRDFQLMKRSGTRAHE
jgi:RimJ/RimL family protein N-acetyltransferase